MYSRFKNSILHPSMIYQYTDSKAKTFWYFVFLLIIFILPNILYVSFTGGLDNSYFVEMSNSFSKTSTSLYIKDYKLCSGAVEEKHYISSEVCDLYFLPYLEDATKEEIKKEVSSLDEGTKAYQLVFTKNNIVGIYSANNMKFYINLATYEELEIEEATLSFDSKVVISNEFAGILYGLYNKYKTLIILITVPSIIISGIIGLLVSLLIPTGIIYLFNRHLRISFGKIFHMGIYAFTIYVFASVLSMFMASSLLLIVCQLISFFYLSHAMRYYFMNNNGGFKNGL